MTPIYFIRDGLQSDKNYIYSSWLQGLYYGNSFYREMDKDSYFKHYQNVLASIIVRAHVRVACLTADPDVIVGYSISRGHILDWVMVRDGWRKNGIGRALVPETITAVTHLTKVGRSLKPKEWVFDPFLI